METSPTTSSTTTTPSHLPLSSLQSLLQTSIPATIPPGPYRHQYAVALQVLHNLQHQHDWTSLRIHTHSSPAPNLASSSPAPAPVPLPRPLVSGVPPQRIYIHPDEQVDLLKRGVSEADVEVKREWVLPTKLREKWTLRGFARVFDARAEGEMEGEVEKDGGNGWGVRRVLLAVVGDDSTIVYYIMHDGIVKPRQN